jgi:stage III sporulation protein AH
MEDYFMKKWKKNLISAGILVTVCCGIYVNWLTNGGTNTKNLEDTLLTDKIMNDDMLVMGDEFEELPGDVDTVSDYFAAVRLSRQEARDSALTLLQEAMSYGDEAMQEETSAQLEQIVQTALCEAQIESLVIAKGYADCVAYITESGISIAVAAPDGGIQKEDVALIADIVMAQTEFDYPQIRVVEVQ